MTDFPRLIEHAFPLKQTSLDSVHEKNVRHGHISTLHIWPARRPLAACRAALIATLLPDPGDPEKRRELCEKIAGKVVKKTEKKKMPNGQTVERIKEETVGGILHWGRETENDETLEWFRQEIKKAYGGRAPKVLDPFAGGGAIPLEAMRLGCEATAVDINPVAWFILKCTLEYPQKLAGQTRPLPDFILHNDAFMAEFFKKAKGLSKSEVTRELKRLGLAVRDKQPFLDGFDDAETRGCGDTETRRRGDTETRRRGDTEIRRRGDTETRRYGDTETRRYGDAETRRYGDAGKKGLAASPTPRVSASLLDADLAWHVRAWGQWVLDRARRELAQYYPTYADFEPIKKDEIAYEHQPMRVVPLKEDGTPDIDSLNDEFTEEYLEDKRNPRWVAKPAVAYLWARTVTCKNCRATVPLLKTRWLCKKSTKRTLLTMEPNAGRSGVVFGIETNVPSKGGNAAQKREHDKRISSGTMSRAGAKCPCCPAIMTMEDIRVEGKAENLGSMMTAVVVDTPQGKAYRLPTDDDINAATLDDKFLTAVFQEVPFGVPDEPTPAGGGSGAGRAFSVQGYGLMRWRDLFTHRQLAALGTFVTATRAAREEMAHARLTTDWIEAVGAYQALVIGRTANYLSTICLWDSAAEEVKQTFLRFALPITWDFSEANPMSAVDRYFVGGLSKVVRVLSQLLPASLSKPAPSVVNKSAISNRPPECDIIVTDPPYYDAIPYSDLMDFFYIWLRSSLFGAVSGGDAFATSVSPKWDHDSHDGELIDDCSRHSNDAAQSKRVYEDGMARAFVSCASSLKSDGRLVIVFANKQPDAWETLVSALIRAGFVVDGSWPIATEMRGGVRNFARASLASSVWLVCKKRPTTARPGWDNNVLDEMKAKITLRLREYWDAGIRGPDFIWAATGPAMEAYSKHPVVRKANEQNATMGVGEFLNHVRRMVVDYVVGQVLTGEQGSDLAAADRLDEVTAYYLLHRHDFGMDEAPVGACILYATACSLSDAELDKTWNILSRSGSDSDEEDPETWGHRDVEIGDFPASPRHRVAVSGEEDDDSQDDVDESQDSGSRVKLRSWNQRHGKSMGYEAPEGRVVPLIDRIHRVMHLWKEGDVQKVDEYFDQHALRRNELFKRVVQSLIELSTNSERALLESISNHIGAKGEVKDRGPLLPFGQE